MSYEVSVQKYKDYMKMKGFSKETIRLYESAIRGFTEYLKDKDIKRLQDLKKEDIREYQNMVHLLKSKRTGKPLSLSRKAVLIVVVRSYCKFLVRTGEIIYNPASDIEVPRSRPESLRETLKEREIKKLIETAQGKDVISLRDRAMLEVLYSTGIRNSELRNLKLNDVDLDNGEIMIREGKGGKSRVLPLGRIASGYIEEYLIRSRPVLLKEDATDNLFLSSHGRKPSLALPIDVVKKYAKKAKIKKNVCTHMIRHSCATHLLRGGADIRYVQELLGHSSLDTTKIYTKIEISDLKKVHRKTHPRERI